MSSTSNVGNRKVYEAGDQRPNDSEVDNRPHYEQGKEHSHQPNDSSMSSLPMCHSYPNDATDFAF